MRHILIFIFLTLLPSCSQQPKIFRFEKQVMGMRLSLQVPRKKGVHQCVEKVFKEINDYYNNWNPHSEISKLNQYPALTPFQLSDKLYAFLKKVDTLVLLTEGRFDPTISPLVDAWKASLQTRRLLDSDIRDSLYQQCGWHHLVFQEKAVIKMKQNMKIDLCAASKGYAVDLLVYELKQLGMAWAYVEWGGEVKTIGCHPLGRKWNVNIEGMQTFSIENEAIATSGGFWQSWNVEEKCYTHIINPKTGAPVELHECAPFSCSVRGASCMEADAIATALMCFPDVESAARWSQERLLNETVYLVDQKSWREAHS